MNRLIEVALPIREISAESVRDKSLRHGHISTLHLWWARRPLAASRAVVFASLVPDPDDPHCPETFRKAVLRLLQERVPGILQAYPRGSRWIADPDPYRPYEGIPDTPRNRLLTFIAKWSPEWMAFEKGQEDKQPKPAEMLDDRCLVKWETSNPESEQGREVLRIARELIRTANDGQVPALLDPFAGGGAIPLEAARLGCQAIANDYNPVAYLILRATCEFPQKFGKPGKRTVERKDYGQVIQEQIEVENVLAHDVEHWANWILKRAQERIGHLYPPGKDGDPIVGYLWARTVPCSNPTCRAEVPLLRSLLICNKPGKRVALTMDVQPHPRPSATPSPLAERGTGGEVHWRTSPNLWEKLKPLAREMRHNSTEAEERLWQHLRNRQLHSFKFRRQHSIERFIADFYCAEAQLVVELDGPVHQYTREEDAIRQQFLETQGLRVLRFTNEQVMASLNIVLEQIAGALQPHPRPSATPSPLAERGMGGEVRFGIAENKDITRTEGTMIKGGDCRCPICQQITSVEDLRRAGLEGRMGERMVAVIVEREVRQTRNIEGQIRTVKVIEKRYRPVEQTDLDAFAEAARLAETAERPGEPILPEITGNDDEDISNSTGIRVHLYGMKTWGSLFNSRQLLAMQTLVACLHDALVELERTEPDAEYRKAVTAYLGIWVSRNAMRMTTMGRWDNGGEKFQTPFDMAKIAMVWDFPEANPFSDVTGGFSNQLNWILRFIMHESPRVQSSIHHQVLRGDAVRLPLNSASADVVVTDPPYYDEIAYADLSDLFYVWLKRGLSDVFPDNFATPLTPKRDEATALKHRHGGSEERAEKHFTSKLAKCFAEAKRVCKSDGVLPVMFAHQTTEAWTALINALFEAGLTITATYPIDTELKNRARGLGSSALESSITVICRSRQAGAAASFRNVRREIERVVAESVHRFFDIYRFKGADLIVACYGPAVDVFGRYERVERGDGTPVSVPELLETVREAALKAIAGEFTGDNLSRLYFVWCSQYGASTQPFDDLVKVAQMSIEAENAIELAHRRGLLVVNGATCRLALLRDRLPLLQRLGASERRPHPRPAATPSPLAERGTGGEVSSPAERGTGGEVLIDQLHHAMHLWQDGKRPDLVSYMAEHSLIEHAPLWKLAQALFEVLPKEEQDWKLISALLGERETLRIQARRIPTPITLFDKSGGINRA